MGKKNRQWMGIGLGIMGVAFIAACAGAPPKPDWVDKGSGAFPGDRGTALYGVGVASKSPNVAMTRTRSENRGRAELAKVIETYIASFVKDFMQEHKDYMDPEASGSQEFTSAVSKSVAEATLVGSQIVDHWTDNEGNLYSLATLPLDNKFLEAFAGKAKESLRERKAQILENKANEMLKQLDEELAKKTERQAQ